MVRECAAGQAVRADTPFSPIHPPPSSPSLQVSEVVEQCGKQLEVTLGVASFVRVQVGEGLEGEEKDFAAEVAETLKAAA